MIKISYLLDRPQYLITVAGWIFKEWGYLMPDMIFQDVVARLQTHLNRGNIPLTLVAESDDLLVGTASLVYEDMSTRPDLSPWLASVYVVPELRNRGIGSQLVSAIEEISKKLCISRVYLFTPDRESFYARLGWVVTEKTNYRNQPVVIMSKSF